MGFEIGLIDHDRLAVGILRRRQTFHHTEKDVFAAPPLPAIVERLRRAIFPRHLAPPQLISIDEDDLTQNAPIINALAAMAL